jgi:hypothetical protein
MLPPAADYFPLTRGVYEVAPGIRPFGTDFGNGRLDQLVFQLDDQFSRFRESKFACRRDRLDKYIAASDFGTDDRLNHHPEPPAGIDPAAWRGRSFVPGQLQLFLRIERQVMWGLPAVNAAVFTIRVFHLSGEKIRADPARRELLRSALLSMSPQALQYKGLTGSVGAVVQWLDAG